MTAQQGRSSTNHSDRDQHDPPASEKPEKYRFVDNLPDDGEKAAEREYEDYVLTQRDSDGEGPDVLLDAPVVTVDELNVNADELQAVVCLQADVLNLLRLHVGAKVLIGQVRLEIKGVEAQALLKVRLANVARILDRVSTTVDRNPELVEGLVERAGKAVGELEEGAGSAVEDVGKSAGEAVEDTGDTAQRTAQGAGRTAGKPAKGARRTAEQITGGEQGQEEAAAEQRRRTGAGEGGRRSSGHPSGRAPTGILDRVWATVDRSPQLLEGLVEGAGKAVGELGARAGSAAESTGEGAGPAVESAGETVGDAGQPVGETVEDAGETAQRTAQGASRMARTPAGVRRTATQTKGRAHAHDE